ncbi:ORF6C domain-containing protein [Acinetobacter sp.]|uniref:ORF6C domain-containing protein n=1 Tax=Acinetobacter sp. TaxID=472 RepID=UPI003341435F
MSANVVRGGKIRIEFWSRIHQHFRITGYNKLLAIYFQDAIEYIETIQIKEKKYSYR